MARTTNGILNLYDGIYFCLVKTGSSPTSRFGPALVSSIASTMCNAESASNQYGYQELSTAVETQDHDTIINCLETIKIPTISELQTLQSTIEQFQNIIVPLGDPDGTNKCLKYEDLLGSTPTEDSITVTPNSLSFNNNPMFVVGATNLTVESSGNGTGSTTIGQLTPNSGSSGTTKVLFNPGRNSLTTTRSGIVTFTCGSATDTVSGNQSSAVVAARYLTLTINGDYSVVTADVYIDGTMRLVTNTPSSSTGALTTINSNDIGKSYNVTVSSTDITKTVFPTSFTGTIDDSSFNQNIGTVTVS